MGGEHQRDFSLSEDVKLIYRYRHAEFVTLLY